MKVATYSEMIQEYKVRPIDTDDLKERERLLNDNRYSVIFEADFLEFDTVQNWMQKELETGPIKFLFYGKLEYDYGFFEVFFERKEYSIKLNDAIPGIFTKYPNGKISRTNGKDGDIYLSK